jgi:hypothetical protein
MLAGWIAGATNDSEDDEGAGTVERQNGNDKESLTGKPPLPHHSSPKLMKT